MAAEAGPRAEDVWAVWAGSSLAGPCRLGSFVGGESGSHAVAVVMETFFAV